MFKGLAQVGIIFFRDLLIHRSLLLFYVMMAVGEKYIYIYIYIYELFVEMVSAHS